MPLKSGFCLSRFKHHGWFLTFRTNVCTKRNDSYGLLKGYTVVFQINLVQFK
jgi:hypothetical protein